MEIKTFNKGEVIFLEDAPGDCMYDVYTGRAGSTPPTARINRSC